MNSASKDFLCVLCKVTCSFWLNHVLVLPPPSLPEEQVHQEMQLGIISDGESSDELHLAQLQSREGISQGFRILIFPTEISTPHISLSQSDSDKFILLWFCLCLSSSSSSLRRSVSPPTPLNFLAAKKQPRQNQQLDWEGRSGGTRTGLSHDVWKSSEWS